MSPFASLPDQQRWSQGHFHGIRLQAAPGNWKPLLEGGLATHARAIVDDIVAVLEQRAPSAEHGFQGDASTALLLAHCGRPSASARLEAALSAFARRPTTISLFAGAAGISWALDRLATGREADSLIAHFDAAVLRYLDVPRWQERYDLIAGLVGVGVSAARHRGGHAELIADRVLSHLEATAIADDAGLTWCTPGSDPTAGRPTRFTAGAVDLGVAHGVPGIIGMLAQFVEADVQRERSRRLLWSAVSWLMYTVPDGRPRFGTNWPAGRAERKRIGWCYGDPGVAGVLLRASRALGSLGLEQQALGLLERATAPLATASVRDACLCHGAAGLAHIYNVAFQRTGSPRMRIEALRWLLELFRLRKPGSGIAGYRFLKLEGGGTRWANDATLVSGAAGVALVLLAAIEGREPEWQALLLL